MRQEAAQRTGHDSDTLASTRWRTALDALRPHEAKSPEQVGLLLAALAAHPSFADMEESLLADIVAALRTRTVGAGEVVPQEGIPCVAALAVPASSDLHCSRLLEEQQLFGVASTAAPRPN